MYSAYIYLIGVIILVLTSLPTSLKHGAGTGGLIAAMIVIGIGTGGIKSNVSPLIAEQKVPCFPIQHCSRLIITTRYRTTKQKIRVEKNGERVIVDPAVTIQRIYMVSLSERTLRI